ncbi:profilin-like isoform X2 [Tubulanus polymorphus]|uniref:profilin-like isoform X2 n=1 Tax=Tubulanus polymorphus TaxID=672921 RepID=UPI003DA46B33
MSWDSYIDNLAGQAGGSADKVWIGGKDGTPWTSDAHTMAITDMKSENVKNIVAACDGRDATPLQSGGVHVNGIKFQFLRADATNKMVLAKKKDNGYVTAVTSKTAVVIAIGKEGTQQGNLNKGVAVISEYLESLGM